jgi:hypothetical protein
MQYLLLINDRADEKAWETMPEEARNAFMAEYMQYTQELRSRGLFVDANQLQPASTATTVSVRDNETVVSDGPFAETKEVLGGYYLIEVDTLDEAIEWAAKIPSARFGHIEVRPVVMRPAEVSA